MRRATQQKGRAPGSSAGSPAAERRKVRSLVRALLPWFRENARDLPWRRTRDPYAIWVSEIMLQQTQVGTVIPYYERWMKALPTIQSLARVSSQRLHKLWEGLGYYTRVRNLQAAARRICREHGGTFPDRYEEVLALPGIGRYTAGAVCSIAYNRPLPILDGNVIRVLTRLFGIGGDPREGRTNARLWELAEALVRAAERGGSRCESGAGMVGLAEEDGQDCSHLNQALMELGATVCTARRPDCAACPVCRSCIAKQEDLTLELPAARKRPAAVERLERVFVLERRGRYLAVKRAVGRVNGGLWEFPGSQEVGGCGLTSQIAGVRFRDPARLGSIKHSITRYRITVDVYFARVDRQTSSGKGSGHWFTRAELGRLPMSAAHRRIATTFVGRNGLAPAAAP